MKNINQNVMELTKEERRGKIMSILDNMYKLDRFLETGESFYKDSKASTELNEITKYLEGELDYRDEEGVRIIVKYAGMTDSELLTLVMVNYNELLKARSLEINKDIESLEVAPDTNKGEDNVKCN